MKTTTSSKKIHLNRVLPGWYSYLSRDAADSFTVLKQGGGKWQVLNDRTGAFVLVNSLTEVREMISMLVSK